MRIGYLDCFAGMAGDMFLGALVDAGVPRAVLDDATIALDLGASLCFETVDRSGISATKVRVMCGELLADAHEAADTSEAPPRSGPVAPNDAAHSHPHVHPHTRAANVETDAQATPEVHARSLSDIRQLLQASTLSGPVKELALKTFDLLGNAEAKIHNVPVDEIHFHEVGAVDAIVDIVCACAGAIHLQVDAWYCSPINVGSGTVRCAHGIFPVPAPATALLLRGLPTYAAHVQKELVTPTGAALIRALSPVFGSQPAMLVESIGYGAGTRNPAGFANVVRLSVGTSSDTEHQAPATQPAPSSRRLGGSSHASETVFVLETALDDATPQVLAYVAEKALQQGALDVMLTPVVMKKGRPGTLLTVLANPEDARRFEYLLLRETTTLGLRVREERRVCLRREHVSVNTVYGSIRVKTGWMGDKVLNAHPEYEDCKRLAEEQDIPLKRVHAAAIAAYAAHTAETRNA